MLIIFFGWRSHDETARASALCCFHGTRELLRYSTAVVRPLFGRSSSSSFFFFIFFLFFFFFAAVDAPRYRTPLYARWMEQVKRPLQLSDSCRRCPIYIRDEPLFSTCVRACNLPPVYTYARAHTSVRRIERNAFSVLFWCTCNVLARTMRDERAGEIDRQGHNGISGASFHPFSTILRVVPLERTRHESR